MKRHLCILISISFIFLTFSSCKSAVPNREEKTTKYEETDTSNLTTEEASSTTNVVKKILLPLPQECVEFYFSSGAGAWGTEIKLNSDGTFTGEYHDSNMGDRDDAYPNGTVYFSSFSGKFDNIKKINNYSYKMTLVDTKLDMTVGAEWFGDGMRYIASEPYGIEEGKDFILYLPNAPVDMLSTDFLTWWPYRFDQAETPRTTLDCYGIFNISTGYGFFYVE